MSKGSRQAVRPWSSWSNRAEQGERGEPPERRMSPGSLNQGGLSIEAGPGQVAVVSAQGVCAGKSGLL